jgi:hypothetical protein
MSTLRQINACGDLRGLILAYFNGIQYRMG